MAEETSIWKKEIRLGRRPRLEEAVEEAALRRPMQTAPTEGSSPSGRKSSNIGSAPGDQPRSGRRRSTLLAPTQGRSGRLPSTNRPLTDSDGKDASVACPRSRCPRSSPRAAAGTACVRPSRCRCALRSPPPSRRSNLCSLSLRPGRPWSLAPEPPPEPASGAEPTSLRRPSRRGRRFPLEPPQVEAVGLPAELTSVARAVPRARLTALARAAPERARTDTPAPN